MNNFTLNTEALPEGTYFTSDRKIGMVYIDIPNSQLRTTCWLVGDWWVQDNGPAPGWSLMSPKRKWLGLRKIDLSQREESKKIQYIRGEKTAKELGFWGA